ncbi:MAG TPA: hypothetical protein VMI94_13430 [Bryobacteraceae bacterium]|nr:hypothetical protein [Bryobacteraceae bacterium]
MRSSECTIRTGTATLLAAVAVALAGCGSTALPPPELTAQAAAAELSRVWARGEMNHFRVTFHSDSLVECGVKQDLWKLVEVTDKNGNAWSTAYRLTERGSKMVTAIDLKESGRGHEILLKGPYRAEIHSISDGSQPRTKKVAFRWDIDWNRASADLKACIPRFELSGNQTALFQLDNNTWKLVSYLNPDDSQPPQSATAAQP